MAGAGNSFDSDDEGEWHTVWKGSKKKRQAESETVENWARGQGVRDRQFEDGRDSSRGNSERGSSRGGSRVGARGGWANRDNDNGSSRDDYRSSGGRGGRGRWVNRDGDSGSARDDSRSGGGGRGHGGWANRDGDSGNARDDFRSGGGPGGRGRWTNFDCDNGSFRDDFRSGSSRGGRGSWLNRGGENRRARANFRNDCGSIEYRGRHDSRGRGRGRGGDGRTSAPRENMKNQKANWNFSTLLCGPADSQIVFTEYQGFCNQKAKELRDKGHIHVPLFRTTTDEEVCQNFREKLRSITASITECKDLLNENCQLRAFIRVGDLYFNHRSFRFDSRPGPQLRDFGDLMESDKFEEASQRLDRFFNPDEEELPQHS
ncbi:hypothetical protein BOX15_Mlig022533g1 [Macrostomum lignano]|uniref:Uncharacterized protein n=1 Tax=Macrostomum lignano TaxID=282301 RepID=A0A267FF12_9PLAT|nr:hypothetical protein BOX15_Mlig022533g1 [Macrostomum lignano]